MSEKLYQVEMINGVENYIMLFPIALTRADINSEDWYLLKNEILDNLTLLYQDAIEQVETDYKGAS